MVHIPNVRPGDFVAWHCDSQYEQRLIDAYDFNEAQRFIPLTKNMPEMQTPVSCTYQSAR